MPNCPSCKTTNSPGTTLCRSCGASIPVPSATTTDFEQEVRSLLDQGKKIEAVKVYKDQTGSSLKDSKDAVEALQRGASLPSQADPGADLDAEVLRLMGQGEKIKAVKLYREQSGATLYDSKQAVERLAERNGIVVEGGGCGGVIAMCMLALIAIAVFAAMVFVQA